MGHSVEQRSKVPTTCHLGTFFLAGRMGRGEGKREQIHRRFFRVHKRRYKAGPWWAGATSFDGMASQGLSEDICGKTWSWESPYKGLEEHPGRGNSKGAPCASRSEERSAWLKGTEPRREDLKPRWEDCKEQITDSMSVAGHLDVLSEPQKATAGVGGD